jgi:hypothetical protein
MLLIVVLVVFLCFPKLGKFDYQKQPPAKVAFSSFEELFFIKDLSL